MPLHRIAPLARAAALSTLLLATTGAARSGEPVWITLGQDALGLLQRIEPRTLSVASVAVPVQVPQRSGASVTQALQGAEDTVHLARVDEDLLPALSDAVHASLKRCGGYIVHASLGEARGHLQSLQATLARPPAALAADRYAINQQAVVEPLLAQIQDSHILSTIETLAAIQNRYYSTSGGATATATIAQQWQALAAGRSDVSVRQVNHGYRQQSVVLRIKGRSATKSKQIVVLGAHMDSILSGGTGETSRAPGADDDASGIASLTEALRVLLASGHRPQRTIEFMAYAAEEIGLRGSSAIASSYASAGKKVIGVMQLDMTNYKGGTKDIYLYTDYTNAAQNTFVANLAATYLPSLSVGTDRCGYACSDHASWTSRGFAASFPFEAPFSGYDPYIHTANDTLANMGNQTAHAAKFARLALSYAVELAND